MISYSGLDEAGLTRLAGRLAGAVASGGVIHLAGPLGAGKTTFARALLGALGVRTRIKSPTYSLIESYDLGALGALHLDLYRIAAAEEVEWLGLRDYAGGRWLWLIEWPERAPEAIPAPDLIVRLAHAGDARDVALVATTALGRQWLEQSGFIETRQAGTVS
jgi:tRNA threonylcarbamoyladenosine biosynthesis protein TsaE